MATAAPGRKRSFWLFGALTLIVALVACVGASFMVARWPIIGTQAGGATLDPGPVIESNQGLVSSAEGGAISLPGGAELTVPPGAIDSDTEVTLVNAEGGNVPNRNHLHSGLYYATSTEKPIVNGEISLTIPYDANKLPAGLSEDELQPYLVVGDTLFPVQGQVDTSRRVAVILNPRIRAAEPPKGSIHDNHDTVAASGKAQAAAGEDYRSSLPISPYSLKLNLSMPARKLAAPVLRGPGTVAYGVFNPTQSVRRYDPSSTCRTGKKGEAHIEPGSPFYIYFTVDTTCDFVKYVDARLQEATNAYKKDYADNGGKGPLDYFSTNQHMGVYIQPLGGDDSAEYEYRDWQGYISVDYDKVKGDWQAYIKDPTRSESLRIRSLRQNLYHELFHAVQDRYRNMWKAGLDNRWWIEATAEYAALKLRGLTFQQQIAEETTNVSKYMLAVNPRGSDGTASYGYSLLISHVEQQQPGYLRDALVNRGGPLSFTYDDMVTAGRLEQTYPDFVKQVIMSADTSISSSLWNEGVIGVSDQTSVVQEWRSGIIGDGLENVATIKDEAARSQPYHFKGKYGPLTTHQYRVDGLTGLTKPRKVRVQLSLGGSPSSNAWLMKTDAAGNLLGDPVRLDPAGTTINGLGKDFKKLYIATFNLDIDWQASRRKVYSGLPADLAITIEPQDTQAVEICSFLPPGYNWEFPQFPPESSLRHNLNNKSLCTARTKDGMISVIEIDDHKTAEAARYAYSEDWIRRLDNFGNAIGEATGDFGEPGYAIKIPPEQMSVRPPESPGYGFAFVRGHYYVYGRGGYNYSAEPPAPYPSDSLYDVAKYIDGRLKNAP
jgi:hypothetical protein